MNKFLVASIALTSITAVADIQLPKPVTTGGMPLMNALSARRTGREFSDRALNEHTLSSLLWAANGINRPADGRRTAPTGRNVQDIDVYVILPDAVYQYDAAGNRLVTVNPGDHRRAAGMQDFAQNAKVNLVYVHDRERAMKTPEADVMRYAGIHAGAIMQNVYLFCAKEGLVTVARGYLDYDALSKALKLGPSKRVILAQTVGYPAPEALMTRDKAIDAALAHAGLTRDRIKELECERDTEDGVAVWEVEFKHGRFEYEYDIDMRSGAVLKSKKDD